MDVGTNLDAGATGAAEAAEQEAGTCGFVDAVGSDKGCRFEGAQIRGEDSDANDESSWRCGSSSAALGADGSTRWCDDDMPVLMGRDEKHCSRRMADMIDF